MTDVPDDLTSVGKHHGNEPPTETGQEVRSPEGPDPASASAERAPALFQLLRHPQEEWLRVRVHSARAEVSDADVDADEIGQYRTVDGLRDGLRNASLKGATGVFETEDADEVVTDTSVGPDHSWIGDPQYSTITFFRSEDAASEYAGALTSSSTNTE